MPLNSHQCLERLGCRDEIIDIHGRWATDTNSSVPKGQGATYTWFVCPLAPTNSHGMDILKARRAVGGCPRLLTTALLTPHLDRVSIYCVLDPEPSAVDWRDI